MSRRLIPALVLVALILAAVPAAAFNPASEFTISRIEPDPAEDQVRLYFSQNVPLRALRGRLRILPRVEIDWQASQEQDGGLVALTGEFKFGQRYIVSLPAELVVAKKKYRRTVNSFFMPDGPPGVRFVDQSSVIELKSRQFLHARVLNVERVTFQGLRIPPLLLPLALEAQDHPESSPLAEALAALERGAAEAEALLAGQAAYKVFLGPAFEEKQLFFTAAEKNQRRAFSLPLTFRRDKAKGALELVRLAYGDNPEEATPPRLFRVTDIGLTYKVWERGLLIWAASLNRAETRQGLSVLALTRQMEAFPLGQTSGDGLLAFQAREVEGVSLAEPGRYQQIKRRLEPEEIAFILAADEDDASFIEIRGSAAIKPLHPVVQKGDREAPARLLRGQVFTERGVYRPGDEVNFKGLVREYLDGRVSPPQGEACRFEMISSRGEKIFTREARLSDFGSAAGKMTLAAYLPLGVYHLDLFHGQGKHSLASTTFQVQEFRPPRHYAELSFSRFSRRDEGRVGGEGELAMLRVQISGSYYAGGPVKHGQVRWKIYLSKTEYQVPGFEDYSFGFPDEEQGQLIESGQSILDENGRLTVDFPLDQPVLAGRNGLLVVASVVDFDGRAASNSGRFQVEPEVFVGLSEHPKIVQAGQSQRLEAIVVDKYGRRAWWGSLRAEVLQSGGTYVRKRNEQGDVYWSYENIWRRVFSTELPLRQGVASLDFDFAWGGMYLVAFSYEDQGRTYTSAASYQVSGDVYWDAYYNRERPYEALGLAPDKEAYRPGETARILVAPQRPVARYLVTLERGGVLKSLVVSPEPGQKHLDVPIGRDLGPNVYLSVLGLCPRGDFPLHAGLYDAQAPGFLFGTVNLPVRLDSGRLKVAVNPEEKKLRTEPGRSFSLEISVSDEQDRAAEAELAVGVVDESVLALTGFATPSLASLLDFTEPLAVFSGELRQILVHQTPFGQARVEPVSGGGGAEGIEGLEAKVRRDFRPVAFFDPAVLTDAGGRVRLSFSLPDTMTTYRVYVVACDRGGRFASAERPLVAVKDFYLEPGLPRFFTRGDSFTFQVKAFNTTAQDAPLELDLAVEGGLELSPPQEKPVLKAGDSLKLNVSGRALHPGPAGLTFSGRLGQRSDAVQIKLPVSSGQVLKTEVVFGRAEGSAEISLPVPEGLNPDQLAPGEARCLVTVAGSPFLQLRPALQYLLDYPYGCVEQTASGVLALAGLRGLADKGALPGLSPCKVDGYLKAGLDRLLSLQTDFGGFAYWPGQRSIHPWGSAYAALGLSQAKASGLAVPPQALKRGLDYLAEQAKRGGPDPVWRAMACYVLALNDRLPRPVFQAALADRKGQSRQARLLLTLAAQRARLLPPEQIVDQARELLAAPWDQGDGDEFGARYREPALALLLGASALPGDPLTEAAALRLLGGLGRGGRWTSTSDTGFALQALSRHYAGVGFRQEPLRLTLKQPGRPDQSLELDPHGFRTFHLEPGQVLRQPSLRLEAASPGAWLYLVELTLPRPDLAASGLAAGFKLTKSVENTDGSKTIRVGDVVAVKVRVEAEAGDLSYVALDDPLPAGLVAINSAFKTEETPPELSGQDYAAYYWDPDGYLRFVPGHFEIRDDRVLAFRDRLWPGTYQFAYFARAVCAGDFVLPPTRVELMYSPQTSGLTPAGRLKIEPREEAAAK